jgi:hypothetical protein
LGGRGRLAFEKDGLAATGDPTQLRGGDEKEISRVKADVRRRVEP